MRAEPRQLRRSGSAMPISLHEPVEQLAVVHLHHILPALDAQRLHRVGGHHADFGVGGGRGGAHRVGVELHELAEAARSRLLVAEDPALAVAAIGGGQLLLVLGHVAGQRRGQVIAQRQPLLVIVLEGEDAGIGPVLVGQELAQRVGVFHEGLLHRLEAIGLVDLLDGAPACGARRGSRPAPMSRKPLATRAFGRLSLLMSKSRRNLRGF